MNLRRILAYSMRHLYLYQRSLARLMEIFYWPMLDLVMWGFITVYLAKYSGTLPEFVKFFIGALILWDILFRSQQGLAISFLEDMWSRNLLNVFVSPMTVLDYIGTLLLISILKLVLATVLMVTVALYLYDFNIFLLGMPLIPFMLNLLIMGWSMGIVTIAIIMRYGQEAEVLAWGIAFLFQPVSAVFYPVAVLPPFVQTIAYFVPSSHIFEGMREVIKSGAFPTEHLITASILNIFYIAFATFFFTYMFKQVKEKGIMAKIGE